MIKQNKQKKPTKKYSIQSQTNPDELLHIQEQYVQYLKYEQHLLKDQLYQHQICYEEKQKELDKEKKHNLEYVNHLSKERQSTLRLLRIRNDNELNLQNDILEKNKTITDLTKKLKESTNIIFNLNQTNNNLIINQKNFSQQEINQNVQIYENKLAKLETDLKLSFEDELRDLKNSYEKEKIDLNEKLKDHMQQFEKEKKQSQNFKTLYANSKQKSDKIDDEMKRLQDQITKMPQMEKQISSMESIQSDNLNLNQQIDQMKEEISKRENEIQQMKIKQKDQIKKLQAESEKVVEYLKNQIKDIENNSKKENDKLYKQKNTDSDKEIEIQNIHKKLIEKIKDLESQLQKKEEEMKDLESEMMEYIATTENEVKEPLQKQITQLQNEIEILIQNKQQTSSSEKQEYDQQIQDIQNQQQITEKQKQLQETEMNKQIELISNQKQRILALELQSLQKQEQIHEFQGIQQTLNQQLIQLSQKQKNFDQQFEEKQNLSNNENYNYQGQINEIQIQNQKNMDELHVQIQKLNDHIDNLQGELDKIKQQYNIKTQQLEEKDKEILNINNDYQNIQKMQKQKIELLEKNKIDLTQLIQKMKKNLVNLRKVFLSQVQSGVSEIQLSRSGNSSVLQSTYNTEMEMEINDNQISVAQEYLHMENESKMVENYIQQIKQNKNIQEFDNNNISVKELKSLQDQKDSQIKNYIDQIEQLKISINIQEQNYIQNLPSSSQNNYDDQYKKLEYINMQLTQNLEIMQKKYEDEVQKKQNINEKYLQSLELEQEIKDDLKIMTEQLNKKDDELMLNYQQYQKQLTGKDQQLINLQNQVNMVQEDFRLLKQQNIVNADSQKQLQEQKLKHVFEIQKITDDYKNQMSLLQAHDQQQSKRTEEVMQDREQEIHSLQKLISMKDIQIREQNQKIQLLIENGPNDLDAFQEEKIEILYNKNESNNLLNVDKNYNNQDTSSNLNSSFNIYGSPDSKQGHSFTDNLVKGDEINRIIEEEEFEKDSLISISQNDINESNKKPEKNMQEYKQQNNSINKQINIQITDDDPANFNSLKRLNTMNSNKLFQVKSNMGLKETIVNSQNYLDLKKEKEQIEFNHQDLQKQYQILQDKYSQLLKFNPRNSILQFGQSSIIRDDMSIVSGFDDQQNQQQMLQNRNNKIKELQKEQLNKDIMIRHLKLEMENYADEFIKNEQKKAIYEQTIDVLTEQLNLLTQSGNDKTQELKRKIEEINNQNNVARSKSSIYTINTQTAASKNQSDSFNLKKQISLIQRKKSFLLPPESIESKGIEEMTGRYSNLKGIDDLTRRNSTLSSSSYIKGLQLNGLSGDKSEKDKIDKMLQSANKSKLRKNSLALF